MNSARITCGASSASLAGKGWATDEDEQLAQAFDAGTAIQVLAATHERSRGAIRARLMKLGKISD